MSVFIDSQIGSSPTVFPSFPLRFLTIKIDSQLDKTQLDKIKNIKIQAIKFGTPLAAVTISNKSKIYTS
ncbi:hypothetical protein Q8W40_00935 [Vibrio penaeicida]|uniref:hypothetical protein n=1 Tax=Vibrio penaeicida TaxID=104609 RepID=UPI002735F71D|nr:hypothetical protein [Vibrio penaeicida]MDP2570729.1 hypothetical protein [Vibrio penaeicida]